MFWFELNLMGIIALTPTFQHKTKQIWHNLQHPLHLFLLAQHLVASNPNNSYKLEAIEVFKYSALF